MLVLVRWLPVAVEPRLEHAGGSVGRVRDSRVLLGTPT